MVTDPDDDQRSNSNDRAENPGAPALDVSIILPVYNEAEHLEQEVSRVRAAMDASPYSYEIIVVDDGSSDNSAEVASRIPEHPVPALPPEPRLGLGAQGRHQVPRAAGSRCGPTST